ncbi:Mechanosensitive ion channel [Pseudodesulfovibrio hydrargyri]|uniref:Mechanosensitive ion channel n=1 Tax=Pseudodesulfovibrio hydrargyri TaxID=2125990 RepID=A0A1J5MXF2_9BACT|nr:mechanosensitive ion channel domain-containing protein [Pseudodesulfovibrio hydrargyri]OIQ50626.1 Mechanosensitive ion channel [Pseudodesulfovibrio hydrargyri]
MVSTDTAGWLVRVLLALVVGAGAFMLIRLFKGGQARRWRDLRELLSRSMKRRVVLFLTIFASALALSILAAPSQLPSGWSGPAVTAMNTAWVLLAAWAATLVMSALTGLVRWRYDMDVEDNLGAREVQTKVRILNRIIVIMIWFAAAAAVLMQFERFRLLGGTMLASAGVLSIVLGISAQKTFGSIIAGIQIALAHPINLDDVVIVEGEWGRIEEITFTYVVVRLWDMRRLVVPITYFTETVFQNWTKKSAEIIGSVFLHVDYATPLEPLRAELTRLCEGAGGLWNGKTCVLQVTDAGEQSMTLRAIVSAPDASKAWDLRCLVREGLIGYLNEHHPECLPKRRVLLQEAGPGREGEA